MGNVICTFKVYPEDMDFFEGIRKALEEVKPERLEEEPMAFGLKCFKMVKFIPDGPGVMEELENKLKAIEGVREVETVSITRDL